MKKLIFIFAILVPAFFVFHSFFGPGPLAWGDAPHFYSEGLGELFSEPAVWTTRGISLGGVNLSLWLSPLMFLIGALHTYLGIGNDLLVRMVFYFPALILAFVGPVLLSRYLKFSGVVSFFAALFYLLNAYFILILDGGVVGVGLAYGVFPLTLLFLKKFYDSPNYRGFWLSLLFCFWLVLADPRIFIICFLTFIIYSLSETVVNKDFRKLTNLKYFLLTGILIAGLSLYWLVPLLKVGVPGLSLDVSGLNLFSLLNSLFLYQPHWPANIFGQTTFPLFYFVGIPLLLFGNLAFKNKKAILPLTLAFLILGFLAKGTTPPLDQIYIWIINKVPFGSAFRDSSKFFIPMSLFAGILIGQTAQSLNKKIFTVMVYLYVLFLVSPALLGSMNFVLSSRNQTQEFNKIYEKLKSDNNSFKSAWFPEKHPLAFETAGKPAIDAKDLVNLRPLSRMNAGSFDKFNFMHNPEFINWFKLLGIKYLVLSGDPRKISLAKEETLNWRDLNDRVATASGLVKLNWNTSSAVFENDNVMPNIFQLKRILIVVGPEINDGVVPAVYLEDGKIDFNNLQGTASQSATLVFSNKDKLDLKMSFLQKDFKGANDSISSDWAIYNANDYLTYKFQLLIRDFKYNDFDYNRGLAFSTKTAEKNSFELNVPKDGEYYVGVRASAGKDSLGLAVSLNGEKESFTPKDENFSWYTRMVNLKKGKVSLEVTNTGGLNVLNVVSIFDKDSWARADKLADIFMRHFAAKDSKSLTGQETEMDWKKVDSRKVAAGKFFLTNLDPDYYWIVFTDNFNPLWVLKRDQANYKSSPIFSALNVFYKNPNWPDAQVYFSGQNEFRWGLYWTTAFLLTIAIVYLWFKKAK